MKIRLIAISKTTYPYIAEGVSVYVPRIQRYLPFSYEELVVPKKHQQLPEGKLKQAEGDLLLSKIGKEEMLILLDERGKSFDSAAFAGWLQQRMNAGTRSLCLVIGGAYGFSEEVYARAEGQISLSKMTFSHQMIRLFAIEQVYRGLSILNGEPYHHA